MTFLRNAALLVLAVWLGGLVALVLFVSMLFVTDRAIGSDAAPVLFRVFERYQLGLAAVAVGLLVVWRARAVTRQNTVAVLLTLAATALAVVQMAVITPRVNAVRNVDRPAFDHYHRLSTKNYTAVAWLVLGAWIFVCLEAARRPDCDPAAPDLHSPRPPG